MKSEVEIRKEQERLFRVFMDPATKKPIHDSAYIKFHALNWVLEDSQDIIEKRLREINAGRTETSKAK